MVSHKQDLRQHPAAPSCSQSAVLGEAMIKYIPILNDHCCNTHACNFSYKSGGCVCYLSTFIDPLPFRDYVDLLDIVRAGRLAGGRSNVYSVRRGPI